MTKPISDEFNSLLRSDFSVFFEKVFRTLNPTLTFVDNWHIALLIWYAHQVMQGKGTRLIVNLPPRMLKSMIFSVALPAYILGSDPAKRIICASYAEGLAAKLSNDFRQVLAAPWFTKAFGFPALVKDTETETATVSGGFRFTTTVGGSLTGRGGDFIIVDDPLNANEANSKASRERVNEWFKTSVLSRLDDPKNGAIVVVMQRLHVEDLSGMLLATGAWTHLCLPAVAQEDRIITYG